jgi:hypothetical protein
MASSKQVLRELSRRGLLLVQDKTLPSVVGIMTGESLRGSWWAHPKGKQIFSVLSELIEGPDVIVTKLLAGKATLVHRGLWAALVAVVASREAWQLRALSAPARRLLETVSREGSLQSSGAAAKELSTRLLVKAGQEHTVSGKHVLVLEDWHVWAARVACQPESSVAAARQAVERSALALGAPLSALPWNGRRSSTG